MAKEGCVSLLNLLRIRKDADYESALDILVDSARKMLKNPEEEIAATLLLSEAEIASEFPGLTALEAKELEEYFISLLLKSGNSLAEYLSKKLNGKVGDYWNVNDFSDIGMKKFAFDCSMKNANDDSREEDFLLRVPVPVAHEEFFRLIKEHYLNQDYQIFNESDCFVGAKNGDKYIIAVVTECGTEIWVTVNVLRV